MIKLLRKIFRIRLIDKLNKHLNNPYWDLFIAKYYEDCQYKHPNPLNHFGHKCFSQDDEDGITLEIIKRLNISKGTYAEFGVADGLENNTLILASLGWKGFWVSGGNLAFNYSNAKNFKYIQAWITKDNISDLTQTGLNFLNIGQVDVASLDLDGNDYYFIESLLENNFKPKLFIVEYNSKFPPGIHFKIKYNERHIWKGDDYLGASITSFVELFSRFNYSLICCNSHTGVNAFFIQNEFLYLFKDIPKDISNIYVPPRYYVYNKYGHKLSSQLVEDIINNA